MANKGGNISTLWWATGRKNPAIGLVSPNKGKSKYQSNSERQRIYLKTPKGRQVNKDAIKRYRRKLAAKWGCSQAKALKLEHESKQRLGTTA